MDINYELYKVFYHVAVTLSFSEASKQLFISQSALSKSIHALEVELGREIFIRTTEGIAATDFGRAFLMEAEKTLQHVERMKKMTSHVEEGRGQPLRFGATCGQMMFASEIFARLLAQYMNVETDFQFAQSVDLERFYRIVDTYF